MSLTLKLKSIPELWFVGVLCLLFFVHFFSNFYVPKSSYARDQQLPDVNTPVQFRLYDYQTVLAQVEQLALPAANPDSIQDVQESQTVPDRFDSWQTDGHSVALMAIYQQQHETALLWLKTKAEEKPGLVRLKQGDQHQGLTLIALTATTATLQFNQKQRTLRLFTPGEKLLQNNNQHSGN